MYACKNSSYYNSHLDKPRLELVINNDVIPVALETVLVVVHHRLEGEKRQRLNQKEERAYVAEGLCGVGNFLMQEQEKVLASCEVK